MLETSLAVQWLRLCASTAWGAGLIPCWGTNIHMPLDNSQKKKKILSNYLSIYAMLLESVISLLITYPKEINNHVSKDV